MYSSLAGKVAIITGAASGIGRATAIRLVRDGASVIIADRDINSGANVVNEIISANGEAHFIKCDVGSEEDILSVVQFTIQKYNRVDVLVNNAAMMTFKKLVDITSEEWDMVMRVNLRSVFLFCKYCIPHMNHGSIINVSSVHAHETTMNVVPYASSKGGIEAFIRGVSMEYPDNVRINCVAPGAVDTPMLWNNPNVKNGSETISGAIAKPEEIADVIAFLASDESSFINGTTLVADGGRLDIL